jgi:hypothetical protein
MSANSLKQQKSNILLKSHNIMHMLVTSKGATQKERGKLFTETFEDKDFRSRFSL